MINAAHRLRIPALLLTLSAVWACQIPAETIPRYVEPVLWRDPGPIERLDLAGGAGGRVGAPRPPFRFVSADPSGSTPKVLVRDARGRLWDVKWGEEVQPEVFASRLVWATGYYVEPSYFVRKGRILRVKDPGRADKHLDKAGRFQNARFELRDPAMRYRHDVGWTWKKNPFVGSSELNGLRVLIMLLSNWDNKDDRDFDSNTGILEDKRVRHKRWIYYVSDWGGSMGQWGGFFTREKWDCDEFARQTPKLISGVEGGELKWAFKGQHSGDFKEGITTRDVRWLLRYLGRISDVQLRSALRASGAAPHETRCFARSIRARIERLRKAAAAPAGRGT